MNPLTARFLAYRAAPKPTPVEAPAPAKKRYPHDGYISATETYRERIDRVRVAQVEGFELGPLDVAQLRKLYWRSCRRVAKFETSLEEHAAKMESFNRITLGGGFSNQR